MAELPNIHLDFFAGLGTFSGGYIAKRFKLSRSEVIKMYIYCQAVTIPCSFALLFYCQSSNFSGVNVANVQEFPENILHPADLQSVSKVLGLS